jgi:hypothetical protein
VTVCISIHCLPKSCDSLEESFLDQQIHFPDANVGMIATWSAPQHPCRRRVACRVPSLQLG